MSRPLNVPEWLAGLGLGRSAEGWKLLRGTRPGELPAGHPWAPLLGGVAVRQERVQALWPLAQFELERLEAWPLERVQRALARRRPGRILFLLDGLAEAAGPDPRLVPEVVLPLPWEKDTAWLCAGQPECGLPEAFREAGAGNACCPCCPMGGCSRGPWPSRSW